MKKSSAALCAALLAAGPLLAACGPQTDERVAPSALASTVPPGSQEPAASASTAPSASAVSAPFVALDCATLAPSALDAVPAGATTIGEVSAVVGPTGPPSIVLSDQASGVTDLGVADIVVGDGAEAVAGDTVTVDYCGVGLGSRSVFDSSWAGGQPVTFPLPNLIAGWQEGIPGMKVGGQRLLVIPPDLGYGADGGGPIGPNESLAFVIQLKGIEPAAP